MPLSELLDGSFDVSHAALFPHRLGGEVAVGSSSIPVSIDGLGVKGDHDTEVFCDPLKDIPEGDDFDEGFPDALTSKSTYLAIHRSSPMVIPSQGPTWNSHWAGITSALVPLTLMPAYRQALQTSFTKLSGQRSPHMTWAVSMSLP